MTPLTPGLWLQMLWLALALTTLTWVASLFRRDASLIDRVWGAGFVLLAWASLGAAGGWSAADGAARTLVVLVTIWGLRLSIHLTLRNWGKGEDPRYRAMRERQPAGFALRSLVTIHWLQGVLMAVIVLPVLAGTQPAPEGRRLTVLVLGGLLWVIGFGFEAVADWQLVRFRADPANRGKVMDRGLWRYSRHPNYFGDALVWWGYFGFALANGAWVTLFGPLLMTVLLLRVSGVVLLERALVERKPGYREYIRRTSAFWPRPPRED